MHKQEEMLWEMLVEADINRYPTTCSIDSTQRCNSETIENVESIMKEMGY